MVLKKHNSKKKWARGALPSSQSDLDAAPAFVRIKGTLIPDSLLLWPIQLDEWGNKDYGDCVTAEEAFAKAAADPQVFIPAGTIVNWAQKYNYLHGAPMPAVLSTMQTDGINYSGITYKNGSFFSVDWKDSSALQYAISQSGPVKIGIDSESLEDPSDGKITQGKSGWRLYGCKPSNIVNHCVSLCGYGDFSTLQSLFADNNVKVTSLSGMPTGMCYAMFTWDSIGIVDETSLKNMMSEAWARSPVTIVS